MFSLAWNISPFYCFNKETHCQYNWACITCLYSGCMYLKVWQSIILGHHLSSGQRVLYCKFSNFFLTRTNNNWLFKPKFYFLYILSKDVFCCVLVFFTDNEMVTLLCYDQLPVFLYFLLRTVGTILWVTLLLVVLRKRQPWNDHAI